MNRSILSQRFYIVFLGAVRLKCALSSNLLFSVRLRPISITDDYAITALLCNDPEITSCTASIPIPFTLEHARTFLEHVDSERVFAIETGDGLVGVIGLKGTGSAEIGYWIGRPYWGRGYASFAVSLLIADARRRGIEHLTAEVFPDNFASIRVLEKCGFVCRGEAERDLPLRGGLRRMLCFERKL